MPAAALVLHAHFYQPRRENPWTGAVSRTSESPLEHVYRTCYRANAFARVLDGYDRVERIVNNYSHLSFDFSPLLLDWLAAEHPRTYGRILEADRLSCERNGGHGQALAQTYSHAVLPLCNDRDLRSQMRWGMADFRHRFGREPEGLWLPEAACNGRVIDALIEEGLRLAVLSPHQAQAVRALDDHDQEWQDVSGGRIDTARPYRCLHSDGSGRSISLFFHCGAIARAIAFEGALVSSEALSARLSQSTQAAGEDGLVHVATEGESYGFHTPHGERTLAYAGEIELPRRGLALTSYGAALARCGDPRHEVRLQAGPDNLGTSWNCPHGVGRWYRDCGCQAGARQESSQEWRTPLRQALDLLRDEAAQHLDAAEGELFLDPWATRDAYIDVLLGREPLRGSWLQRQAGRALSAREAERALALLEVQRHSLLMYASPAWSYADIASADAIQALLHAARLMDLLEELDLPPPRQRLLEILSQARSNSPEAGNGADIYRKRVEPSRISVEQVAAHLAISSLLPPLAGRAEGGEETAAGEGPTQAVGAEHAAGSPSGVAGYLLRRTSARQATHGRLSLATARLLLEDSATGRRHDYAVAALHFGGVDFYCVLRPFPGSHRFNMAVTRLWSSFRSASLPTILRIAQESFGPDEYGLESVFSEERRHVSELVLGSLLSTFAEQWALLFEMHQRTLAMLRRAGLEPPAELRTAVQLTLGRRFEEEVRRAGRSREPTAYLKALQIAEEVARGGFVIDRSAASRLFSEMVTQAVSEAAARPTADGLGAASALLRLASSLGVEVAVEQSQEILLAALAARPDWPEELAALALALGIAPGALPDRAT